VWAYLALLGAGVTSFLSPCVLPLMPAYVGMMAGEAADEPRAVSRAAGLFVVGFTVVFVGLGMLAGQLGSSTAAVEDWVPRLGGFAVIVFGLVLLGRAPQSLRAERRLWTTWPKSWGALRPVAMGVTFGAAWTPCVGPLLGAALVAATTSADPWRGAGLLFAYSLGVGVPFIATALAISSSPRLLAWLRRLSSRLAPVSGVVLVVLGVLLVADLYDDVVAPLASWWG